MSLPGIRPLQSMIRRVGNRLSPPPVILLYHRVADAAVDPQQLAVSPAHFAEHLERLSGEANVISLTDLLKWLPGGRWPRRAVVITFDDGYADNLLQAAPLLDERSMPATFFLTSGFIGRNSEFFWDELERIFLQPGWLPGKLQLEMAGRVYRWELHPMEQYSQEDAQKYRHWNVLEAGPTVRHTIYRTLCEFVRKLSPQKQQAVMKQIRDWAGAPETARPTHRTLTKGEVIELAGGKGMEIGAHTVTHPMLAMMSPQAQAHEIQTSRTMLETLTGRPPSCFSYPYGSSDAFNDHTLTAVRNAGFQAACTTLPTAVSRQSNALQLPRQIVRDWEGGIFATRLREWFIHG